MYGGLLFVLTVQPPTTYTHPLSRTRVSPQPNAGSVSFDAALRAMNDTARAWQEEEPGVDKTAQEAAAADAAAAASLSVTTSGDASSGAAAAEDVARDIRNSYTVTLPSPTH